MRPDSAEGALLDEVRVVRVDGVGWQVWNGKHLTGTHTTKRFAEEMAAFFRETGSSPVSSAIAKPPVQDNEVIDVVIDGISTAQWLDALEAGSPVPGTDPEPGTAPTSSAVPSSLHRGGELGTTPAEPVAALYVDIAQLLAEGLPEPPAPVFLRRTDGHAIFYAGQVSLLFGEPETGKGWVALAACTQALLDGHRVLVIDLDHNGPEATVSRLIDLGAPLDALRDQRRFRYVEPEDFRHLVHVVEDAAAWKAELVMLDSIGELLPLAGANSNSPDDFTRVHRTVMKPLAAAGAAVVCIDHVPKNPETSSLGATGTAAKRRAIGGVSLRVRLTDTFVPDVGGACTLLIHKDRHGGLRRHSPTEDREPVAGTFRMTATATGISWRLHAPQNGERNPVEAAAAADVQAVAKLSDAERRTVDAVREALGWRKERAGNALREYRKTGGSQFPPPVSGTGNYDEQAELDVAQ